MYYVVARYVGLTVDVFITDTDPSGVVDLGCDRRVVYGPIPTMSLAFCVQCDLRDAEQERMNAALADAQAAITNAVRHDIAAWHAEAERYEAMRTQRVKRNDTILLRWNT